MTKKQRERKRRQIRKAKDEAIDKCIFIIAGQTCETCSERRMCDKVEKRIDINNHCDSWNKPIEVQTITTTATTVKNRMLQKWSLPSDQEN